MRDRQVPPLVRILRIRPSQTQLLGGSTPVLQAPKEISQELRHRLSELAQARRTGEQASSPAWSGPDRSLHTRTLAAGAALTGCFARGPLGAALREAVADASSLGTTLRLGIDAEVPGLGEAPWEALRLVETNGALGSALALHPGVELCRVGPSGVPPSWPAPAGRLRVLAALSFPDDPASRYALLDFDAERERLLDSTEAAVLSGRAEFEILEQATLGELASRVNEWRPDIVHLCCHGVPGSLVFEDDSGREQAVGASDLMTHVFGPHRVPLLVLAGCSTAQDDNRPWARSGSLAAELVEAGHPVLVAMAAPVGDVYARRFAAALYERLTPGGVRLTAALAGARREVEEGRREAPDRREDLGQWATPVLLLGEGHRPAVPAPQGGPKPAHARLRTHRIGRRAEIRFLCEVLRGTGSRIVRLTGAPGVGCTVLAEAVAAKLARDGGTVRHVRPSAGEPARQQVLSLAASAKPNDLVVVHERSGPPDSRLEAAISELLRAQSGARCLRVVPCVLPREHVPASPLLVLAPLLPQELRQLAWRFDSLRALSRADTAVVLSRCDGHPGLLKAVAEGLRSSTDRAVAQVLDDIVDDWISGRGLEENARALAADPIAGQLLAGAAINRMPWSCEDLYAHAQRAVRAELRSRGAGMRVGLGLLAEGFDRLARAGLVVPTRSCLDSGGHWTMPAWLRPTVRAMFDPATHRSHHRVALSRYGEPASSSGATLQDLEERRYHALAAGDETASFDASVALVEARHGWALDPGVTDRLCVESLALVPELSPRRSRLLFWRGKVAQKRGRAAEARAMFEECLVLERGFGHPAPMVSTCQHLASSAHDSGDPPTAGRWADEALALALGSCVPHLVIDARETCMLVSPGATLAARDRASRKLLAVCLARGDDGGAAHALLNCGVTAERTGDHSEAEDCYQQAAIRFLRAGDPRGRAMALELEGRLAGSLRRFELAMPLLQEALKLRDSMVGDHDGVGSVAMALGEVAEAASQAVEARRWFSLAYERFEAGVLPGQQAWACRALGWLALRGGRLPEAQVQAERAVHLAARFGLPRSKARSLLLLGVVTGEAGETRLALELLRESIDLAEAANRPRTAARAHYHLADLAVRGGAVDAAAAALDEALRLARETGARPLVVSCLHLSGAVQERLGLRVSAEARYREARGLAALHEDEELLAIEASLGRLLISWDRVEEGVGHLLRFLSPRLARGAGVARGDVGLLVDARARLGVARFDELVRGAVDSDAGAALATCMRLFRPLPG